MRVYRTLTPVALLALCVSARPDELRTGRLGVLLDLHGYKPGAGVVVPLAPLVHWMGATVQDVGRWTAVARDDHVIYLQLPQSRPRALGALVGVRQVAEALGAEVRYRPIDSEEAAGIGHIRHVEVTDGDRVGRIFIHEATPDTVAALLADVRDESYGQAWLLQVTAACGDWLKTHEPQSAEGQPFGDRYVTGVLHLEDGHWRYLLRSSKVSHTHEELADAGIPLAVARMLQMELED